MIGLAALVPPNTCQTDRGGSAMAGEKMASPVLGSGTAARSATARLPQPVGSVCQTGLGSMAERPLPAPSHAASLQPRGVAASRVSVVPPTAVTLGDAAG